MIWSVPRGGDEPERGRASAMVLALLPSPFASPIFIVEKLSPATSHSSL